MSRENPGIPHGARQWRSVTFLERAPAHEEFMKATREGGESVLRGQPGIPPREACEAIRRREGKDGV